MGMLVEGRWKDVWYDTASLGGKFVRKDSSFRNWITAEPGAFQAEPDRYHLYVSLACPWAHRALIMRALKGLEQLIPISVVNWLMVNRGWTFDAGPGVIPDPIHNAEALYQIYQAADPGYTGRVSVPVLWDKRTATIVNNESADIIRMLNSAFDGVGAKAGDYYPAALREEIDRINDRVYETLNDGVYQAGFATSQEAYEEAVEPLFETLDWLEEILHGRPWLAGDRITEADIRLFTTLIRFDPVYHGHFKCNIRRIADYPRLSAFLRAVYSLPGVAQTVDFGHIKRHYYQSHHRINPSGIVPVGPLPAIPSGLFSSGPRADS
jgi:putative glutathione S-transferase